MKLLPVITLLIAGCSATPNTLDVKSHFFSNTFLMHTSQHDIVNIYVPLNQFNYEDPEYSGPSGGEHPFMIFFAEADISNGQRTDKGLYVYKNEKATKLLDNGRDAAATHENVIYLGAKDGIYKYNEAGNKAVKHGSVTDNIIQLAHNNKTNEIYYLTKNHEVFKLNEDATASVKVAHVKDAQKIVFGFEGNMYFIDSKNNVFVVGDNSVHKKVNGIPSGFNKLVLVSPIYGLDSGALLAVDDDIYFLRADATVSKSPVKFSAHPTAYAPQATLTQFYALGKKIYEFNLLKIMYFETLNEVKVFMDDKTQILQKVFRL